MEKKLNIKFTAAGVFIFLFAAIIFFSLKGMVKVYRLRSEQQKINVEIANIKKNNKKIAGQILQLKNNNQYIANMAREKLNMIKKGEIVFKFIGKDKKENNINKTVSK